MHMWHVAWHWTYFITVVVGTGIILGKIVDRMMQRQRPAWMIGLTTVVFLAGLMVFRSRFG